MIRFGDGQPSSPLRFSIYARDLEQAIFEMSHERMQTRIIGSDKFVTMDGKTVMVSATATDQEIATALNLDKIDTVAKVPAIAVPLKPPASGSFAASLRAIMDEAVAGVEQAKADGLSKVRTAASKLGEAKAATVRVTDNMATNIEDQAASIMSELGQISNDL